MSAAGLFAVLAAGAPERVLLRDTTRSWCAAALLDEVRALASRLSACRLVAILADNSPAWVMADLAALHAGKPHLPLPTFFTPELLAHALDQTGADVVLTDQPERIEVLRLGFADAGSWQGLTWMRRHCAPVALPAGTAKISFTSGSTGAPKGVCLTAEGLLATARALVTTLADLPIDRHLAVLPLALLLENVAGVYAPLLRGAEIALPGLAALGWRGMAGFDPAALNRVVGETGPRSLILVPELLKAWSLFLAASGQRAPDGLRFVAVGGARSDPTLIATARSLGLPVYEGYGLTECGSVVSLNHPGADSPGTVGRPLPHVSVRVDCAREIRVAGGAFAGYLGDARTAAAIIESFPTGDLGHLDAAGALRLSGRRKNLIVTAYGRNVAPEWVEAALTAQPEITQAMVVGDARPCLVGLLVAASGAQPAALSAAIDRANASLPDYARVRAWLPVAPMTATAGLVTANGRPRRAAILARYAAELDAVYANTEQPPCPSTTS